MKIGVISDIHFEFWFQYCNLLGVSIEEMIQKVADACNQSDADIIVNAGDVHPDARVREWFAVLITKPYYTAMGNHDYYGSEFSNQIDSFDIDGVKLLTCTLWTNFRGNVDTADLVYRNIADQRAIKYGSSALTLIDAHKEACQAIERVKPDIIISHFMPFLKSIAPQFSRDTFLNQYFCNDLDLFVRGLEKKPKLWICGHTHWRHEYEHDTIRVVCNPLGYPGENNESILDYKPMMIEYD